MRHPIISKKKSWFYSPWVACILILLFVWGAISAVKAYKKQSEAIVLRNQARSELADLEAKQGDLSAQIQDLSTDRGVETLVRGRYRVVRPGEQLVIVVDNKDQAPSPEKQTFWKKLRQYVGI